MSWDIAACGTLHRDDITTPHGTRTSLGGSAVYFALAASRHATVHLNSIVGSDTVDGYRALLEATRVDIEGVVVSEHPTFTWHATHDFERWVTSHESAEPGCDAAWSPLLSTASSDAPVLFLGSMDPHLQLDVLCQSKARLIGADSMTVFIREKLAAVRRVAESADVLFLNIEELRMLTGQSDWRTAASSLCGRGRTRAVVVKRGPDGAACVSATGVTEIAAHAVDRVIDPTGAGDALAGGFLGHCAQAERGALDVFAQALAEGVRCAAGAVSSFGVAGLLRDIHGDGGGSRPPV
ncbi:MAG: PfkB family carbohydrate kinase [Candidatus Dormibacteria bacterium]